MREYSWLKHVRREDGRLCETAQEYFCELFFDYNRITRFPISNELFSNTQNTIGCFLYEDLIPNRKLDATASFLGEEEREASLDLAKRMLVSHPEARKTAGELVGHPFFN